MLVVIANYNNINIIIGIIIKSLVTCILLGTENVGIHVKIKRSGFWAYLLYLIAYLTLDINKFDLTSNVS